MIPSKIGSSNSHLQFLYSVNNKSAIAINKPFDSNSLSQYEVPSLNLIIFSFLIIYLSMLPVSINIVMPSQNMGHERIIDNIRDKRKGH